ncbi:MAG: flagellar biosynthetic protein FliO [Candidatus Gastranaerophilaceae bacterium]|nr:flagellar biosynthetic protein FliO [Candidatus Gastranaerophilaceae bacterium]
MGGYLANFAIYTMAMIGLIFFALMVYKKFSGFGDIKPSKSRMLGVEETISIAPRKTLYVVRAGSERFLIAGDVDKTTLISKLGDTAEPVHEVTKNMNSRYHQMLPQSEKILFIRLDVMSRLRRSRFVQQEVLMIYQ